MIEQSEPAVHPLSAIAIPFGPSEKRRRAAEDLVVGAAGPCLATELIKAPALVLDHHLQVVWQNESACCRLWKLDERNDQRPEAGTHLFDLLFHERFQAQVDNWRHWAGFFLYQALTFIPETTLRNMISSREGRQREYLEALLAGMDSPDAPRCASSHCLRQTSADGHTALFTVIGTTFDALRLIVFQPTSDDASGLDARLEWVRRKGHPVNTTLFVLAGQLDNADTLKAEMLDDTYTQMANRILEIAMETLEQHGGLFRHHSGCGFHGLFIPDAPSENQIPEILPCAFELKARMADLNREWKIRSGWDHELLLNIGIHAGEESLLVRTTANREHWMPLGNTQRMAFYLADLAMDGQIWATKALIRRMPTRVHEQFRFGIYRDAGPHQAFVPQGFARIHDLGIADRQQQSNDPLGAEAVTQIIGFQG
jgi:class 3 adenylate cyclase